MDGVLLIALKRYCQSVLPIGTANHKVHSVKTMQTLATMEGVLLIVFV